MSHSRDVRFTDLSIAALTNVYAGLAAADPEDVGPRNYATLRIGVRDGEGRLVAGLDASTAWRWLQVHGLWVDEEHRRRGLGTRLMDAAEAEAVARGCRDAMLQTFDFQARGFYERRGYRVWAVMDGFPAGHEHFSMRKPLVAEAAPGE